MITIILVTILKYFIDNILTIKILFTINSLFKIIIIILLFQKVEFDRPGERSPE